MSEKAYKFLYLMVGLRLVYTFYLMIRNAIKSLTKHLTLVFISIWCKSFINRKEIEYNCYIKLIYPEKAAKLCEISTLLLSYVVTVERMVEISQNFEAFSKYTNFNQNLIDLSYFNHDLPTFSLIIFELLN